MLPLRDAAFAFAADYFASAIRHMFSASPMMLPLFIALLRHVFHVAILRFTLMPLTPLLMSCFSRRHATLLPFDY